MRFRGALIIIITPCHCISCVIMAYLVILMRLLICVPPLLCDIRNHYRYSLQWRHNGRDGVSNHQHHDCLLNRLFRCRSKKTSKLRVTGFCAGNSPVTCEFPAQRASNAENVSFWWRHHYIEPLQILGVCKISPTCIAHLIDIAHDSDLVVFSCYLLAVVFGPYPSRLRR